MTAKVLDFCAHKYPPQLEEGIVFMKSLECDNESPSIEEISNHVERFSGKYRNAIANGMLPGFVEVITPKGLIYQVFVTDALKEKKPCKQKP